MKHTYITTTLSSDVHIGIDLATKAIPIKLPTPYNLKGHIRFPRLHYLLSDGNSTPNAELLHPIRWKDCGESASSGFYGSISYLVHNNVYTPQLSIHAFVVDIESNDFLSDKVIQAIKAIVVRSVDNIMCILSITEPKYVASKVPTMRYHFVSSCAANYDQVKGNRMVEIGGTVMMTCFKSTLPPSILFPLIRQGYKELTLQYQMLAELKHFLEGIDYRSCVLHASTIFETTLLQMVDNYLSKNSIPPELSSFIHKKIGGFTSYESFYKMNIFSKCTNQKVKATVELRNKVIHEGKAVNAQEARDAYEAAKSFLEFYKWPYFVES